MTKSFTEKQLRFTFVLDRQTRFADGTNTLVVTGLRATVDITYPGPPSFPSSNMRIFGMASQDMRALTALTQGVLTYGDNSVIVEANNGDGWTAVFAGQIITAVPDFAGAPDVALQIFSQTLGFELLNPATPSSFPVAAEYVAVITAIAAKMNRTVTNSGVSGTFNDATYFANTPAEQLRTAAKKANIQVYTDIAGVVEICPVGGPRNIARWVLSPDSGLIGYPTLRDVNLIGIVAVFNPALRYGAQIQVSGSDQVYANGNWQIYDVTHRLSSLMPDGPWFSELTAQPLVGFVTQAA